MCCSRWPWGVWSGTMALPGSTSRSYPFCARDPLQEQRACVCQLQWPCVVLRLVLSSYSYDWATCRLNRPSQKQLNCIS